MNELSSTTSRAGGEPCGGCAAGEARMRCWRSAAGPERGRGVRVQITWNRAGEDWKVVRALRKKSRMGLWLGRRARAFMLRSIEGGMMMSGFGITGTGRW